MILVRNALPPNTVSGKGGRVRVRWGDQEFVKPLPPQQSPRCRQGSRAVWLRTALASGGRNREAGEPGRAGTREPEREREREGCLWLASKLRPPPRQEVSIWAIQ